MTGLSLYKLESDLAELLEMRQQTQEALREAARHDLDPQTAGQAKTLDDELTVIDNAIADYLKAEVRKVDGIRAVWRHLENQIIAAGIEIEAQTARRNMAKQHLERLKTGVQTVMQRPHYIRIFLSEFRTRHRSGHGIRNGGNHPKIPFETL